MLDKMLAPPTSAAAAGSTVPDVVTLDLEDSVRTEKKAQARRMVTQSVRVLFNPVPLVVTVPHPVNSRPPSGLDSALQVRVSSVQRSHEKM